MLGSGAWSPHAAARHRASGSVPRAMVPTLVGLSSHGLAVAGSSGPLSSPCSCWMSRYCHCCCPSRHHMRGLVPAISTVTSPSLLRSLQSCTAAWPYLMVLSLPRVHCQKGCAWGQAEVMATFVLLMWCSIRCSNHLLTKPLPASIVTSH